jgi:hypothetical protein
MVPAEYDLRVVFGEEFVREFCLFNYDDTNDRSTDVPAPLFDTDVVISVKRYLADSQQTLYTWDSATDSRVTVTPHTGSFTLTLSVADVSVFTREHAYDVFLRAPEGMLCVIQGRIFPAYPV